MAELKSIVQQYTIGDYGKVNVKLKEVLESRGITRNRLKELTGVKYDVIDRYYKNENISLVDIDAFSKFCFVLDCGMGDLLEYVLSENTEKE